jgi:linoleoyl-CoA desaturase
MSDKTQIIFSRQDPAKFWKTLNKRVNDSFVDANGKRTSQKGNLKLYWKTLVMFSLYLVPYFLLLSFNLSLWIEIGLTIIMGIGMAGIGMNVMHDANHGAYSSKKWVNNILGGSIYILAGNVYNWKVQHNLLHHTYTNIQGHDEDIKERKVFRITKYAKWFKLHKYQHYYSIFLYGLLTFNWVITTDFQQTFRYLKRKLSVGEFPNPTIQWITLIFTKAMYIGIWIVIPILFFNIVWWQILIGFFLMHYVAGIILSVVFQLAHVVEEVEVYLPASSGTMENTHKIHQLFTTANFDTRNKLVNWFTGGLNHQIEHHIFPHISHAHYTKISKIVKDTAQEFKLPYYEYKTIGKAFRAHIKWLKKLSINPKKINEVT